MLIQKGDNMASTRLYLDLRGASGADAPLKITLTHKSKSAHIPLGIRVPIEAWNNRTLCLTGTKNRRLQLLINEKKNQVDNALYDLMCERSLDKMSAIELRDEIEYRAFSYDRHEEAADNSVKFIEVFERVIDSRPTEGTKAIYRDTLNKVKKFARDEANSLTFEDIDYKWLTEFDSYLSLTMKSQNSKSLHFRNLRAVFNAAIDDELTEAYPFRKFKIKNEETKKRSLSVEQLRLFMTASLEPWMERYRDVFMLLFYFCGINIVDLCHLKEIVDGRIEYKRAKTHKLYSIKVEPEAKRLIMRLHGDKWLLNILDLYSKYQDFNRKLKRGLDAIVEHINKDLPKSKQLPRISSYWARHTWATMAADIDIPIETISAALGHSYGCATTAIYIRFNQKKVDLANRKVIDYIFEGICK